MAGSAPQDAVELAERIVRVEKWRNSPDPHDTISVDLLLSQAEGKAALVVLAQAVLELEKAWLEAEGKHSTAEAKLAEVRAVLREADRVVTWESTALSRSFQDVVDAAISGEPIPTYAHAAIQSATKEEK